MLSLCCLEQLIYFSHIARGSYISHHTCMYLLNELEKSYKMRGFLGILSLFRNKFNKLNYPVSRMLDSDSIYHMKLK